MYISLGYLLEEDLSPRLIDLERLFVEFVDVETSRCAKGTGETWP